MSGMGFCLEHQRLRKLYYEFFKNNPDTNGAMVTGVMYHEKLKELLKNHPYGKAHYPKKWYNPKQLWNFIKLRPRFEKIVKHDSQRGWKIRGHCDIDIPALDLIIEFKSTGMNKEFSLDDPIIQAYILQANAYAYRMGRRKWELWIIYIKYKSIHGALATVISGHASLETYELYEERCDIVWNAYINDKELIGPEMDFECNNCMAKKKCGILKKKYQDIVSILPCKRNDIIEATNETMFKFFYRKKWIIYNHNSKDYALSDSFKNEFGVETNDG